MHTTNLIHIAECGIAAEGRYNALAIGSDEVIAGREPELDRLANESRAAVLAAADADATSIEQLLAKARLLATVTRDDGSDDGRFALARSLLRDLERQAKL